MLVTITLGVTTSCGADGGSEQAATVGRQSTHAAPEATDGTRSTGAAARRYTTTVGDYRFRDVEISVRLPRGWSGYRSNLIAPGVCGCSYIHFRTPPRVVWDPTTNTGIALERELTDWLMGHPLIRVRGTQEISMGGVRGTKVVFDVLRNDPQALQRGYCGLTNSAGPCLPITADPSEEGYVSLEVSVGGPFTYIVLRPSAESRILVTLDRPEFEEVLLSLRVRVDS